MSSSLPAEKNKKSLEKLDDISEGRKRKEEGSKNLKEGLKVTKKKEDLPEGRKKNKISE